MKSNRYTSTHKPLQWLLCLVVALAGCAFSMQAQNRQLTLKVSNVPVKEALSQIEKEGNYVFIYQSDAIDLTRKVSVDAVNKPLPMCSATFSMAPAWNGT